MKKIEKISNNVLSLFVLCSFLFLSGCSPKYDTENYNKPAVYWYNKILQDIATSKLDDADEKFISLRSEHSRSLYIEPAMILLIKIHTANNQYKMADYYADEYIKTYPLGDSIDYVNFLKLKASYNSLLYIYRQQAQLDDIVLSMQQYIKEQPNTTYRYLSNDMLTRLKFTKHQFNNEIVGLYGRIDKPKAKEFYNKKAKNSSKNTNYKKAKTPWYMMLFEEGSF